MFVADSYRSGNPDRRFRQISTLLFTRSNKEPTAKATLQVSHSIPTVEGFDGSLRRALGRFYYRAVENKYRRGQYADNPMSSESYSPTIRAQKSEH